MKTVNKMEKDLSETGGVTCLIYEAHKDDLFLLHNGEKYISEDKHLSIVKKHKKRLKQQTKTLDKLVELSRDYVERQIFRRREKLIDFINENFFPNEGEETPNF